jgi:hypothetical protein
LKYQRGLPRSGSVQRDCIRRAEKALGRAIVFAGPPDTTFFIFNFTWVDLTPDCWPPTALVLAVVVSARAFTTDP